ncbi:MAG: hypothetical protein SFW07_01215, partial [Gammaproteobacteria bacterium]|nr:hypothetical protein [Gammaproteobacteria bacterium]
MREKIQGLIARLQQGTQNFNELIKNPSFVKNCMAIIELGWQPEFEQDKSLSAFKTDPHDLVETILTRRYLLKCLLEAHQQKLLSDYDREWFMAAEANLNQEFSHFMGDTWSDHICRYEPAAITVATMFYLVGFTKRGTHSPLVTILLSTLPAVYTGLTTMTNVIPTVSTHIRNRYFSTSQEMRVYTQSNAFDSFLAFPGSIAQMRSIFGLGETASHLIPTQPSPLEKTLEVAKLATDLLIQSKDMFKLFCEQKTNFVEDSFELAENGWKHAPKKFFDLGALVPFQPLENSNNPFDSLLKRLYLVKLLSDLNYQPERCLRVQHDLLEELKNTLERSYHAIHYHGREIRTEEDFAELQRAGVRQLRRYQPTAVIASASLLLDFIIQNTHLNPGVMSLFISLISVGSLATLTHLYRESSAGLKTLFFADSTRVRLDKRGVGVLTQPEFRKNYLSDNNNNAQVAHPRRNGGDEVAGLMMTNSIQVLLGGVGLMVLGGILNGSPRSVAFWFGFLLMAASLYYNPEGAKIQKDFYERS